MAYSYATIDGRKYRWSDERRVSGRPAKIQYQRDPGGNWRDVRNVDRSDQIWRIADGAEQVPATCKDSLQVAPQVPDPQAVRAPLGRGSALTDRVGNVCHTCDGTGERWGDYGLTPSPCLHSNNQVQP